MIQVQDQAVC